MHGIDEFLLLIYIVISLTSYVRISILFLYIKDLLSSWILPWSLWNDSGVFFIIFQSSNYLFNVLSFSFIKNSGDSSQKIFESLLKGLRSLLSSSTDGWNLLELPLHPRFKLLWKRIGYNGFLILNLKLLDIIYIKTDLPWRSSSLILVSCKIYFSASKALVSWIKPSPSAFNSFKTLSLSAILLRYYP